MSGQKIKFKTKNTNDNNEGNAKVSTSKKTNEEIVKLDHRSHILKLPETYTGSLEKNNEYGLGICCK